MFVWDRADRADKVKNKKEKQRRDSEKERKWRENTRDVTLAKKSMENTDVLSVFRA